MANSVELQSLEDVKGPLSSIMDDLVLVDPPWKVKRFCCYVCSKLALEHIFANCGDIFCQNCSKHLLDKPCPACGIVITEKCHDPQFETELFQLKVECQNNRGCQDHVVLIDYLKHKKECRFSANVGEQQVEIPNAGTISVTSNWWVEDDALDPNVSYFVWLLSGIPEHTYYLEPYYHSSYEGMWELETQEQSGAVAILTDQLQNDKCGPQVSARIHISAQGLEIGLKLLKSGTEIFGDYYCKSIMLDQSENIVKNNAVRINTLTLREETLTGLFPPKFSKESVEENESNNETYVKFGSVVIHLILHPVSHFYKPVLSRNGHLFWRIGHYLKVKQDCMDGVVKGLHSLSFYTSEFGHRVQARVFLEGNPNELGKPVVVKVMFVPGEFDEVLPTQFNYSVSFSLLDQRDFPKKLNVHQECQWLHLPKKGCGSGESVTVQQTGCTFNQFAFKNHFENPLYLMDGSLLFEIKVDVSY